MPIPCFISQERTYWLPQWSERFTFLPRAHESSPGSPINPHQDLLLTAFTDDSHSDCRETVSTVSVPWRLRLWYSYVRVLFSHKEVQDYVTCWKMDGPGDHHIQLNRSNSERWIPKVFSHLWVLDYKQVPICHVGWGDTGEGRRLGEGRSGEKRKDLGESKYVVHWRTFYGSHHHV